jgi:hypothetical protein
LSQSRLVLHFAICHAGSNRKKAAPTRKVGAAKFREESPHGHQGNKATLPRFRTARCAELELFYWSLFSERFSNSRSVPDEQSVCLLTPMRPGIRPSMKSVLRVLRRRPSARCQRRTLWKKLQRKSYAPIVVRQRQFDFPGYAERPWHFSLFSNSTHVVDARKPFQQENSLTLISDAEVADDGKTCGSDAYA